MTDIARWMHTGTPGLGGHLYDALGSEADIIGVAKTAYKGGAHAEKLLRGRSQTPLYITASGNISHREAARMVARMHGPLSYSLASKSALISFAARRLPIGGNLRPLAIERIHSYINPRTRPPPKGNRHGQRYRKILEQDGTRLCQNACAPARRL